MYSILVICMLMGEGSLSKESQTLIEIGRSIGVQSIVTGTCDIELQNLAEQHARWMASNNQLNHNGFQNRANILFNKGYNNPSEICSASWSDQSLEDGAKDAFKSWKSSGGHNRLMQQKNVRYGYALVLGKDNKWYAVGLFAYK